MKKHGTILLIAATMTLIDVPVQAAVSLLQPSHTSVVSDLFGRKRKGAKPRRGGLFNTGLFRKKNPCGCPGH